MYASGKSFLCSNEQLKFLFVRQGVLREQVVLC